MFCKNVLPAEGGGMEIYMRRCETYSVFCEQLEMEIASILPEGMEVERKKILQNNRVEFDSLHIFAEEKKGISPNFYLNACYEEYKEGKSISEIAQEIAEIYQKETSSEWYSHLSFSLENCQNYIFYRLVSFQRNRELLETIPYIPFLDLCIVFYILLEKEDEGIRSVRISNQLQQSWGMSTAALYSKAQENTRRLFPQKICSMRSMMLNLLEQNNGFEDKATEDSVDCGEKGIEPYVLTNEMGIHGAAVVLYPDILEEMGRMMRGDYYLLPSSIHEMLAVDANFVKDQSELSDMVKEVNASCVKQEEILSDQVYYYSIAEQKIEMV